MPLLARELAGPSGAVTFAIHDGEWILTTTDDLARQTKVWADNAGAAEDQDGANKLVQGLEEIEIDNQPLSDALDSLAKQADVTLNVDWAGLGKADITEKTPVTLFGTHLKLSTALDLVLTDAAGTSHAMTYTAKGQTISITLKSEATTRTAAK